MDLFNDKLRIEMKWQARN